MIKGETLLSESDSKFEHKVYSDVYIHQLGYSSNVNHDGTLDFLVSQLLHSLRVSALESKIGFFQSDIFIELLKELGLLCGLGLSMELYSSMFLTPLFKIMRNILKKYSSIWSFCLLKHCKKLRRTRREPVQLRGGMQRSSSWSLS